MFCMITEAEVIVVLFRDLIEQKHNNVDLFRHVHAFAAKKYL